MLDRSYEIKQWVAVLLHLSVLFFLIFPLCSPAPMTLSSASMMDIAPLSRPDEALKDNLTALSDAFLDGLYSKSHNPTIGRRSLSHLTVMNKRYDTDTLSLKDPKFVAYLKAIEPNPASWQSPMRLSYGLLGTCFSHYTFGRHNNCSGSSLRPRLSAAQIEEFQYTNSTKYLAAQPDEVTPGDNSTSAEQSFSVHLDTSMLPSSWGPVPSLQLAVLVLMTVLIAGTVMPMTLFYVAKRHPMSRYSTTTNPVTERISIKYQQIHCFLLPFCLAAEFALTVVTRINVKQYVKAFNQANMELWMPSDIMMDTFADLLSPSITSKVQSQTLLYARAGTGFDLYYTALATHLALVLMCYELYRDDTSRCRVRIHHELNWSANAELMRAQGKRYRTGPETPPAIKRDREQSLAQQQRTADHKDKNWASRVGAKIRFAHSNVPPPRSMPHPLDLSDQIVPAGKGRYEPRTPHGASYSSVNVVPSSDSISPAAHHESINNPFCSHLPCDLVEDLGSGNSGDDGVYDGEVKVQIDVLSHSTEPPVRPFCAAGQSSSKSTSEVKRVTCKSSSFVSGSEVTSEVHLSSPQDRTTTVALLPLAVPSTAVSETTFDTITSPWVAENGQHAMQMEILHPDA